MSKKMSTPRAKVSREFIVATRPPQLNDDEELDRRVVELLRAWYKDKVPPPAKRVDIRAINDPKWIPLVTHFGTAKSLAEFLGGSEMSIGRWVKGKMPEQYLELKIRAIAEVCGVRSPL